ncbi:MAG: type II toxin-antitoxin system Phd/YefM family antitoxin [Acetobacteraceae bacterium]|nr:type II toxin-antitoxin system Phd/YefM family antitoxin [Acetobacteraceae bacterium]
MKTVNVHEAKSTLSALLAEIERGEEIVIARSGVPVAKLVRITAPVQREPGILQDAFGWRDFTYNPGLFAPLTDQELAEEGWV